MTIVWGTEMTLAAVATTVVGPAVWWLNSQALVVVLALVSETARGGVTF